jgi:plastocyanin
MNTLSLLLLASLTAGKPGDPATVSTWSAPRSDETGSIAGKFVWEGEKPEPRPKLTIKESETTGCKHGGSGVDAEDHSLMIDANGGVANVVVTVTVKDKTPAVPAEPILMDQLGCVFQPHVVVMPVGATLRFGNSDDTNHNIHTFAKKNQPMNKQVAAGSNLEVMLDKAEVIDVKCDVHTWMKAYVFVTDAVSYGVTAADGSFKLEGLPPGEYQIEYWHEELGKGKTEKVMVEAGKTAMVEQKLSAKKEGGGKRKR